MEKMKKILFVVLGNAHSGMGHIYRSLYWAGTLSPANMVFVCLPNSELAFQFISQQGYCAEMVHSDATLLKHIIHLQPDVVINDCLNTSANFIKALKKYKITVINFEDLGSGAKYADLVFNALYEERIKSYKHVYCGYKYFELRPEFLLLRKSPINPKVQHILFTFGGTDPNNFTLKCLRAIRNILCQHHIAITLVTGPGYQHHKALKLFLQNLKIQPKWQWIQDGTTRIEEFMQETDLCVASNGRTPFELTALGVPAIIISANKRETTHAFSKHAGFACLGICHQLRMHTFRQTFLELLQYDKRMAMRKQLNRFNVKQGHLRVLKKLKKFI